uniref:Uncharacterized protein n=1 Tax=viral metagenome TaxID=1070528 RepID=A0A6H2A1T2_9ZZZZ
MERVIIEVRGGCVEVISQPDGIEVEVRDYDTEGLDGRVLDRDNYGESYLTENY